MLCSYIMYNPLNFISLMMDQSEPKHVGETKYNGPKNALVYNKTLI
jgi:hypothetical protein